MIWQYLVFFFVGLAAGMFLAVKTNMGVDTILRGQIKIKQRGRNNSQRPSFDTNLPDQDKRGGKIRAWRLKRSKRKLDRIQKKM